MDKEQKNLLTLGLNYLYLQVKKLEINMSTSERLLTIKEASEWATDFIGRDVTTSNILYLVQYGRIKKNDENGSIQVSEHELLNYYNSYNQSREIIFKEKLGNDLNWALSFEQYQNLNIKFRLERLTT